MSLTVEEVRRVALLARLALTPEEEVHFAEQLGRVVDYVRRLESLDVDAVQPMAHPLSSGQPERPDVVKTGLSREEALSEAPQAVAGGFAVPRIIE